MNSTLTPSPTGASTQTCSAELRSHKEHLRLGGEVVLAEMFERDAQRLQRMLLFRMSTQLRRRIDVADVLQETWLRIRDRFHRYVDSDVTHFYVWLYQQASQSLIDLQRRHCMAQNRNVNREVLCTDRWWNPASSEVVSDCLVASLTSPSEVASRRENLENVRTMLEKMEEVDRAIISLYHFEGLTMDEVAELVGLKVSTTRTRYYTSLRKLREHLRPTSTECGTT